MANKYVTQVEDVNITPEISYYLGMLIAEHGQLFDNYPINFNTIMEKLNEKLLSAGWVKKVDCKT